MTAVVAPVFLIGIGNPLRRDDGIGGVVAMRLAVELEARGVRVVWRCVHQIVPELAEEAAELGPRALVLADAAPGVAAPELVPIEPGSPGPGFGHSLDAGAFVMWVRTLYSVSAPAWQLRLPAADFAHGEGFSQHAQAVLEAIPNLAHHLMAELGLSEETA